MSPQGPTLDALRSLVYTGEHERINPALDMPTTSHMVLHVLLREGAAVEDMEKLREQIDALPFVWRVEFHASRRIEE